MEQQGIFWESLCCFSGIGVAVWCIKPLCFA